MSVLDASVVLKWFVKEKDSEKADVLRNEYYQGSRDIIVPDLLLYELANALRYHPDFTADEIKEAIDTLFDMGIEIITPTYALLHKSIDISKENNITCYDAVYLALAEDLQVEYVTADEKFYKKLSSQSKAAVRLLKSIV